PEHARGEEGHDEHEPEPDLRSHLHREVGREEREEGCPGAQGEVGSRRGQTQCPHGLPASVVGVLLFAGGGVGQDGAGHLGRPRACLAAERPEAALGDTALPDDDEDVVDEPRELGHLDRQERRRRVDDDEVRADAKLLQEWAEALREAAALRAHRPARGQEDERAAAAVRVLAVRRASRLHAARSGYASEYAASCRPYVTMRVRRGSVRTVARTGAESSSSMSLSERTVVSTASRRATTRSAITSPIEKPRSVSFTGAGLVFVAETARATSCVSPAVAVSRAPSLFRSDC